MENKRIWSDEFINVWIYGDAKLAFHARGRLLRNGEYTCNKISGNPGLIHYWNIARFMPTILYVTWHFNLPVLSFVVETCKRSLNENFEFNYFSTWTRARPMKLFVVTFITLGKLWGFRGFSSESWSAVKYTLVPQLIDYAAMCYGEIPCMFSHQ